MDPQTDAEMTTADIAEELGIRARSDGDVDAVIDWAGGPKELFELNDQGVRTDLLALYGPGGGWPEFYIAGHPAVVMPFLADYFQEPRLATYLL